MRRPRSASRSGPAGLTARPRGHGSAVRSRPEPAVPAQPAPGPPGSAARSRPDPAPAPVRRSPARIRGPGAAWIRGPPGARDSRSVRRGTSRSVRPGIRGPVPPGILRARSRREQAPAARCRRAPADRTRRAAAVRSPAGLRPEPAGVAPRAARARRRWGTGASSLRRLASGDREQPACRVARRRTACLGGFRPIVGRSYVLRMLAVAHWSRGRDGRLRRMVTTRS